MGFASAPPALPPAAATPSLPKPRLLFKSEITFFKLFSIWNISSIQTTTQHSKFHPIKNINENLSVNIKHTHCLGK
jgi:hypothetical protein